MPPIDSEIDRLEAEMENTEADIEESKERYTGIVINQYVELLNSGYDYAIKCINKKF